MSYFRKKAEALHLAISEDGFKWKALNGNKPILYRTVNTKTMRDPFIIKTQNGRFHLFCTDGWRSRHIIHCFSHDLLNWSEQEALPVMVNILGAKNSWAPECYYDREKKLYKILWSSTVRGLRGHRVWSTTTEDFKRYDHPNLFFDPGYSVIDATVTYHNDEYLMAFKDERVVGFPICFFKAIRVCSSKNGSGPFTNISGLVTPKLTEGPTLFRCDNQWIMFYDHYFKGHYGASSSDDGHKWKVIANKVQFPDGVRHCSIFSVDDSIAEKLRREI